MGKGGKSKSTSKTKNKKTKKSSKVNRDIDDHDDETNEIKRDLATENVTVCCGLCCINCGIYTNWDCLGFSGKIGLLCLHCKVCCKCNSYCKTCGCCGPSCQNSGCALCNIQLHGFCAVISGALPCNKEVPLIVNILGYNLYPRCGCCMTIGDIKANKMERGEKVPQSDPGPPSDGEDDGSASASTASTASTASRTTTTTTTTTAPTTTIAEDWWTDPSAAATKTYTAITTPTAENWWLD